MIARRMGHDRRIGDAGLMARQTNPFAHLGIVRDERRRALIGARQSLALRFGGLRGGRPE